MRILSTSVIEKFAKQHADARASLETWRILVSAAKWHNWADVKRTFRDADLARDRVVFNIRRDDYRLIADIDYEEQEVTVEQLLGHRDYDRWNDSRRGKGPGR